MCAINTDECDCSCHTTGAVHIMPCCMVCPVCKMAVRYGAMEAHERRHQRRPRTEEEELAIDEEDD